MDTPAAIRATYSDWRTYTSRKVLRLFFEVPIEQQEDVLRYLGPPPTDKTVWVGIALLNEESRAEKSPVDPMVREAGMLCKDARFRRFIYETANIEQHGHLQCESGVVLEESAASYVRDYCGITSRTELATNADARAKWLELKRDYNIWLET